jgi:hypothetical protein
MAGRMAMMMEPDIDDLLADEMMVPVLRSAGTDAAELRALCARLALDLPAERLMRRDCRGALAYPPPAA